MPSSSFDFAASVAEGYVFTQKGPEWNVITPSGRHGAGPTPEDAILNVDSQILFREGKRVLIRADQSEVDLDPGIKYDNQNRPHARPTEDTASMIPDGGYEAVVAPKRKRRAK